MTVHVCSHEPDLDGFEVAVCFRSLVRGACGDQHVVWQEGSLALFAVADGLGHGKHAADAATTATHSLDGATLSDRLRACHEALHGTRGAAVMLAAWDPHLGELRLAGVGNVAATLIRHASPRRGSVMGLPGIVGHRIPRRIHESRRVLDVGDTLVIATDGIAPDLPTVPGSLRPAAVAREIIASSSITDDALVLVAERIR
jgi:negative regulator of sigma-B (phosphoserine phosphatase)